MSRKFIASILAVSIAVTGLTAAPAKAGNDDLVRFLAGATALVIIGKALDGKDDHRPARSSHVHDDRKVYFDRRHDPRSTRDWERSRRFTLPAQCRRAFWTPDGNQRYLNRGCLRRNYDYTHRLPNSCKITFFEKNQRRNGYSISCLKDAGYRISRN